MESIAIKLNVSKATEHIKKSLNEKGFTLFCDINHQSNAESVDLDLPESRVLIFGNPVAGTKLMQKDITISLDLPLRLAIVEKDRQSFLLHQTLNDYTNHYQVENHPVLEKIESLFNTLVEELR